MNYRFSADLKDGYLHVRVQGENTPETIRRYLQETLEASIQAGCPNVLIEEDLEGERLPIGQVFSIIEEKSASFRSRMRLAAYVDLRATSPANMQFAETVAVNRGVTVAYFGSVADAEAWIRQKLAPPGS